jgi:hypothetical protein
MAVTATPIFAQAPLIGVADMSAITACTTRGPTATASLAGANIIALVPTQTNGCRIDKIRVKASSTSITAASVAALVTIWIHDGTTAYPFDEISITAVTPSTTTASFSTEIEYDTLQLPSTHSLYASTTVTTTASTSAFVVEAFGGAY